MSWASPRVRNSSSLPFRSTSSPAQPMPACPPSRPQPVLAPAACRRQSYAATSAGHRRANLNRSINLEAVVGTLRYQRAASRQTGANQGPAVPDPRHSQAIARWLLIKAKPANHRKVRKISETLNRDDQLQVLLLTASGGGADRNAVTQRAPSAFHCRVIIFLPVNEAVRLFPPSRRPRRRLSLRSTFLHRADLRSPTCETFPPIIQICASVNSAKPSCPAPCQVVVTLSPFMLNVRTCLQARPSANRSRSPSMPKRTVNGVPLGTTT